MRLLMLGTGPFAVPTFHCLCDSHHEVAAVVTRPERSSPGRRAAQPHPMRQAAEERGVPVLAPEDVNADDSVRALTDIQPDLLVVCDFGQILSARVLATARLGGINLHGSLLPKYRGAAPVNWAIYHGETATGVTVFHVTPRLDAGPILSQRRTAIGPEETAIELEQRLSQLGASAVHEAITLLEQWDGQSPIGTKQDASQATRAPRLKKSDGEVDWSRSAQQIYNQHRALKPWPGTYTTWQRQEGRALRLLLVRVSVVTDDDSSHRETASRSADPGTIVAADSTKDAARFWVVTGQGVLSLDAVQPEGKRVLSAGEFLNGYSIRAGERLGT